MDWTLPRLSLPQVLGRCPVCKDSHLFRSLNSSWASSATHGSLSYLCDLFLVVSSDFLLLSKVAVHLSSVFDLFLHFALSWAFTSPD